jgi:hypothetical protein
VRVVVDAAAVVDLICDFPAAEPRVQWVEGPQAWESEPAVIALMRPPLNRAHNATHPFSGEVGRARERYRAAARANAVAANP